MSHFKAKMHLIRFLASVRPFVCLFLCLGRPTRLSHGWTKRDVYRNLKGR